MLQPVKKLEQYPPFMAAIFAVAIDLMVGYGDYVTGYNVSVSIFYLIGVAIGVWFIGFGFGVFMSALSVATGMVADLTNGVHFANPFIPIWNGIVLLIFYLVFTWVLARLHSFNLNLEGQVRQRTIALTEEMTERERLERELLGISEREQRRIGQDLHDSLCQHLTGATLAAQVLEEKLTALHLPVSVDAGRVVGLVEQGIDLSRRLARGLSPLEMTADGLMLALEEYATTTSELFKVSCHFQCDSPVLIHDATTAGHLYRIAQEAVGNALKHGRAAKILIHLEATEHGTLLSIKDDGIGLPAVLPQSDGMGLRIMAHRSAMIGARFQAGGEATGGTLVTCELPTEPIPVNRTPWINQK
jgi:signal transduction histidine kinase